MARYRNADNAGFVIQNWMRNRNVIRFLGLWERLNNPDFNYLEFEAIEKEAGVNSFVLTPKRWTESTNAIGIVTKAGRYAKTSYQRTFPVRLNHTSMLQKPMFSM